MSNRNQTNNSKSNNNKTADPPTISYCDCDFRKASILLDQRRGRRLHRSTPKLVQDQQRLSETKGGSQIKDVGSLGFMV